MRDMGARVLVVDDEPEIRAAVRMVLEDAGHNVEEARNGREALDLLRESPRGMVVLLDYMMPVMNGAEVLDAVIADGGSLRQHAYIMVTAARHLAALQDALTVVGGAVVPKPFDIDQLVARVEQAAEQLVM